VGRNGFCIEGARAHQRGLPCTGPASGYCIYRIELVLADGGSVVNLYIDESARDHNLAALAIPASYRTAP